MSQKWFRFVLLSLLVSGAAVTWAAPSSPARLHKTLTQIEKKYARAKTLKARFKQVTESALLREKTESSGMLFVKQPGKIRWETEKPHVNLLVSDGVRAWFYRAPRGQEEPGEVIERKMKDVQSDFARKLLTGSFQFKSGMEITSKSENLFVLVPKKSSAGNVKEAELRVDPVRLVIEGVVLLYEDGNRSEITLTELVLGQPLLESQFKFVPPPGTLIHRE